MASIQVNGQKKVLGSELGQGSNSWNDSMYTSYLDSAGSWLTDKQREYMMTNPWLASRQAPFTPTWLQSLFNDGKAEADYYQQMRANAMDWASKAMENFRQENYNNESEQVMRQAAAGLNPDLLGSVDASKAAENDEASQAVPQMSDFSSVGQIGSAAMKFFQFIMTGANELNNIKIGQQQSVLAELGANSAARDYFINNVASSHRFKGYDVDDLEGDKFATDLEAAVAEAEFPGYSRFTKKYLRRFSKIFRENSLAMEDVKWKLRESIMQSKQNVKNIMSSPDYDDSYQEWINNGARMLSSIEYQTWRLQQAAAQKGWSSQYFHHKVEEIQNSAMSDLYDWVNSGKNWYNTLGVIGLPILGQGLGMGANILGQIALKKMPNLSISHSFIHK